MYSQMKRYILQGSEGSDCGHLSYHMLFFFLISTKFLTLYFIKSNFESSLNRFCKNLIDK